MWRVWTKISAFLFNYSHPSCAARSSIFYHQNRGAFTSQDHFSKLRFESQTVSLHHQTWGFQHKNMLEGAVLQTWVVYISPLLVFFLRYPTGILSHVCKINVNTNIYIYIIYIYIWVRVKRIGMDQGPGPTHDPYPPIHSLIHTPDPYLFLVEERLMLALMLALMLLFILILLLVLVLLVPLLLLLLLPLLLPLLYYRCYYCCYYCCLRCLHCLRAAAAAAAATTNHLPPRSCCSCCRFCCCSCWSCFRCWCWFTSSLCLVGQNATSWLATSNIASAPWRLVRPVLVPLGH